MIRKLNSSVPGHLRIVFELPASVWADRVYLTGDFNDWCENDTPLRQARDGAWRVALDLPVGQRFQYRYVVDGQWQTDWSSDGSAHNSFGSQNSIVDTHLPEVVNELGCTPIDATAHEARLISVPSSHVANRLRYPLPNGVADERAERVQTRPAA